MKYASPTSVGLVDLCHTSKEMADANAIAIGLFYLLAALTSFFTLKLNEPALCNMDNILISAFDSNQIISRAFLEMGIIITAAGTGIMLFPYLRKLDENKGFGHFRFIEIALIILGFTSILSLLSMGELYIIEFNPGIIIPQKIEATLRTIHQFTEIISPYCRMGVATCIYSFTFFQTALIPKFISKVGIAVALFSIILSLIEFLGFIAPTSYWRAMPSIPVFVYELALAIWLFIKRFNRQQLPKPILR